jgi:hypothetical protein
MAGIATNNVSFNSWYAATAPRSLSGADVLYVTAAVASNQVGGEFFIPSRRTASLTRVQTRRDVVEHFSIHICVDGPVCGGVVTCRDEHRISLGHGDVHYIDRVRCDIRLSRKVSASANS